MKKGFNFIAHALIPNILMLKKLKTNWTKGLPIHLTDYSITIFILTLLTIMQININFLVNKCKVKRSYDLDKKENGNTVW